MIRTTKDSDSPQPGNSGTKGLSEQARLYVLKLFNEQPDTRLVYHNYQRTARIVNILGEIGHTQEVTEGIRERACVAAWFTMVGYLLEYKNPTNGALNALQSFFTTVAYPNSEKERMMQIVRAAGQEAAAESPEAQLLLDAIHAVNFTSQFFQQRPLLRLEWELMENRRIGNFEWNQLQLQALLNARFYTAFAKVQYEPMVGQNILLQKEKVEKNKFNAKGLPDAETGLLRKFQGLERKLPASAIQTFFRTNYRNHINLSAIADNKANIMISVNAILISVVISIMSYKNVSESNPMVLLPVVIFLVTGLTSLIFAVLSIRPKVTSLNQKAKSLEEVKKNIVFFGNFINLELEQYEEAMDAVFRDGELLYGNMTRDIYYMGKVLDKKYRFLTMSYNIFMLGFISTVLTFLVAIFS